MVVVQAVAVLAAVVVAVIWWRGRRRLARIEQRFVDAVLAGDHRLADVAAGEWFAAATRRRRPAMSSVGAPRRGTPGGGAAPGSGLAAA